MSTSKKRINFYLPEDQFKALSHKLVDEDISLSGLMVNLIDGYLTGSASLAPDAKKTPVTKEPTSMDLHMAYLDMDLDGRVEFNVDRSRKEHTKYQPDEVFDEEHVRTCWVANVQRELDKEQQS